MPHAAITAFSREHGLGYTATLELQGLVERLLAGTSRSVLATLLEPPAPVSLYDRDTLPVVGDQPAERREARAPVAAGDRYERLSLLGTGGMGAVWRVRDRDLNRTMAMKVIRSELMERASVLARFVEEAQCSAQLQHPGIVPVHELGRLPTGELYFTMREVRGRTLTEMIAEVHWASRGDRWETSATGWTFRKLIDAFHRVCEAVAYAHARGVVHRDLKPDNVMLGAHGEVLVVDWGLAKVVGRPHLSAEAEELDGVVTDRSADASKATRMGAVAGTPAYMAPEQAQGAIDRIDARSDVYSLGAILYEVLSGRPPYGGDSAMAVLQKVLTGPPRPVGRIATAGSTFGFDFDEPGGRSTPAPGARVGPPLPEELIAATERALARDREARFADARELATEIAAWLDGARRREQALEVVAKATALGPEADRLRRRGEVLRGEAEDLLAGCAPWQPQEDKTPGWDRMDEAAELEREADRTELRLEQGLYGALRIDAALHEAHAALAERHLAKHAAAEAARDAEAASRAELALSEHAEALPAGHEVRARCAAYLQGTGALTLVTEPPGAEVLLHRYETRNRRLVPVFERSLGRTPLSAVPLEKGSYLCTLRHPGRLDTPYPVLVERQGHWNGVPPGAVAPHPVWLPRPEDLEPDDCYVPAGWFWSGGDPEAAEGLARRRLWCPAFVVKRFPVTNRAYIAFLDDLVATGREEEALRHAPRERAGKEGETGALIYGRRGDGRFELVADADGDRWELDWPVMMVDWSGALAYAAWLAARTGRPWRLPGELMWEKAARGVDGRFFPWGDVFDPSWCCMRDSHADRPLPAAVDTYPVDRSPYQVRGMAGGIRDWCEGQYRREGPVVVDDRVTLIDDGSGPGRPRRPVRGGSWSSIPRRSRAANRSGSEPWNRLAFNGFRVCRTLAPGGNGGTP